jgi:hypothetical protein
MNNFLLQKQISNIKDTFLSSLKVNIKNKTTISDIEILTNEKEVRIYLENDVFNKDTLIEQPRLIFSLNKDGSVNFRDNLNELEFEDNNQYIVNRIDATISLMSDVKNICNDVLKKDNIYNFLFTELKNKTDECNKNSLDNMTNKSKKVKP